MKNKMGITIEQARDVSADRIAKREATKAKLIDEMVASIDEMIALNIDNLLKRPVIIGEASWQMTEHCDEIMARYKDFTVYIHHNPHMTRSITAKLADKDWDWHGYGVKPPQDAEQPKPKKKRFLWWGKSKQPDRKFTVL